MKKDVVYIDIEDDITSIIAKIKGSSEKIVALVPPKRIGALQSIVNLKLLQKAATGAKKRVVLITSDQSLTALAAGVAMPVAKNLQSRPEVPVVADAEPDDNDIINGDELPVGDLAKTSSASMAAAQGPKSTINDAAQAASVGLSGADAPVPAVTAAAAKKAAKAKGKGGLKIPNFDTFRKKLFLFGGLGVFLIAFLVWAIVFAPKATVTIAANTQSVNVSQSLTLDPNVATDISLARLKPIVQQVKKSNSVEFDTTGTKEIGQKASGRMNLTNAADSDAVTVPAGTTFTSPSGLQFTSNAAVTVPGARVQGGQIRPGSASVTVSAAAVGAEYNLAPQNYVSSAVAVAAAGEQMSGGSKETVNVVAAEDVEKAKAQLKAQDENAVKQELTSSLTGNVIVIQESFKASTGDAAPSPAVGEQARRAKLTAETTYSVYALQRSDVDSLLNDILNREIEEQSDRRIYNNGNKDLRFSQFQDVTGGISKVQLQTTGYVGPTIDEKQLADRLVGKRHGEIQQIVEGIEGVEKVDINFSPFWVIKAPEAEKITIRFTVKNNAQ